MEVDNPQCVEENSLPRGHAIHVTMIVAGKESELEPCCVFGSFGGLDSGLVSFQLS